MIAAGLPAQSAPSEESIRVIVGRGDIVLRDNGLAPTFVGANRVGIIIVKERDPAMPQGWLVSHVFGPTTAPGVPVRADGHGTGHMGILRWITSKGAAGLWTPLGLTPTTPIGFRRASLPICRGAEANFVRGLVADSNGVFWTTLQAAEAQGAANGVVAISA